MAHDPVAEALAGAKQTLANANKFTQSVTGNATNAFAPHEFSKASYKMPRETRKKETGGDTGSFMGVESNKAPEINEAIRQREEARKLLEQ